MENTVFSLRDLRVVRPGAGAFRLHVRSLDVRQGQLLALTGPSGCGKSTALDVLAGILRPDSGDGSRFLLRTADGETDMLALWRAGRLDALARLRGKHLGYVLQTGGLLPFLSARDNILLPCRCLGIMGRRLEAVWNMATALGIDRLLLQMPDSLSVGERQRVAIARALAHGPAIVQQGTTVIMVSHDPQMAREAGFTLVPRACSTTEEGPLSVIDHPQR